MRIRLADYVADFLVSHGVTDVFSVVGGGAMHLNDFTTLNRPLGPIITTGSVLSAFVILSSIPGSPAI